MAELMEKQPPSPKDYWRAGPVYIKKWVLIVVLISLSILIITIFGLPVELFSTLNTTPPAYRYNDARLVEYSGLVCILDQDGIVRYEGEVEGGSCTGHGLVFASDGQLVYEGPLIKNLYEGADAKVYRDGLLVYTGEMADNTYEGQGSRTNPQNGIVSAGQFSRGVMEGAGKEFAADGTLLREGTFSSDLLEGEGLEYGKDNILLREGNFSSGLLHGVGKEYTSSGALRYEGEFERGVYHGQGKLYDTLNHALSFEGTFVKGRPTGLSIIYHPSGQKLFEGVIWEGRPRADSFLGLSLTEVEAAFSEHWDLYTCGEYTAFVYPTFDLMFITQSPILLSSPTQSNTEEQQKEQAVLDALSSQPKVESASTDTQAKEIKLITPEQPPLGGNTEDIMDETDDANPLDADADKSERYDDEQLAPDSDKSDIIICEVISIGQELAGVAQPNEKSAYAAHMPDWREWFSDYEQELTPGGTTVRKSGQFIYEFTPWPKAEGTPVDEYLAEGGGIQARTVIKDGKGSTIWYQSAVRMEES